jgi:hypothetical protein
MNSISIERSALMSTTSPAPVRAQGMPSIEAAIERYASAATTAAPQQGEHAAGLALLSDASANKDYAAIAHALLARLDALRERAMQWREGIGDAGVQGSGVAAPAGGATAASWRTYAASPTMAAPRAAAAPLPAPSPSATLATALAPATASGGSVTNASELTDLPFIAGLGFTFNDRSSASLTGASVDGTDYGIIVDNQQTSENVSIDGFTARNVRRYGMYLGAVRNWSLNNITLQQGAGASEHGLRIADGEQVTLRNSSIDTTRGHKASMWLINVNDVLVENTNFSGGAIRLGARPNDNQGAPDATNIVIRDCALNKVSGGDAEAIQVWPGSNRIHLANLDITLETSDNWLSIDSRNVGNITWENIRVNGRLITGFEGVKLGGMSEQEALARGIGPAGA